MSTATPDIVSPPASHPGSPTWEMALLYPSQGDWTEEEYLALDTTRLIEFTDGVLEFLPMPNLSHQAMAKLFFRWLFDEVEAQNKGLVFFAPCPVRLRSRKYREPDVFVVQAERIRDSKSPPDGADLVVEIVSEGNESRERDLVTKRKEYAAAGIPEYWIVDPETTTITVLALDGKEYRTHGEFRPGETATSVLFPGIGVDVAAVFEAGKQPGP